MMSDERRSKHRKSEILYHKKWDPGSKLSSMKGEVNDTARPHCPLGRLQESKNLYAANIRLPHQANHSLRRKIWSRAIVQFSTHLYWLDTVPYEGSRQPVACPRKKHIGPKLAFSFINKSLRISGFRSSPWLQARRRHFDRGVGKRAVARPRQVCFPT